MSSKSKEAVVSGGNICLRLSLVPRIGDGMENGAKQKWPTKRISNLLNGFSTDLSICRAFAGGLAPSRTIATGLPETSYWSVPDRSPILSRTPGNGSNEKRRVINFRMDVVSYRV